MTKVLKALLAGAALVIAGNASAQTVSDFTFSAVADYDPTFLFGGSFSLSENAGVFSLTAFSGQIGNTIFDVNNVGLEPFGQNEIGIGGKDNGVLETASGSNDFAFTLNPTTLVSRLAIISRASPAQSGGARFVILPAVAAVPEPATWAMLILGFGLIGGMARRRRSGFVHA